MVVVLCSLEISFIVCKKRSCRAIGCAEIIDAAWDWHLLDHSMHWDEPVRVLFRLAPSAFGERYETENTLARERFLLKTLMDNLPDPSTSRAGRGALSRQVAPW
jgi:hypothetical protein